MPTFEVRMKFDSAIFVLVDAEDEEQAQEKAEDEFDAAEHIERIQYGYWGATDVELVDDGTEEDTTDVATD